jgi:orotidine-5'-phosphate decarboxylase
VTKSSALRDVTLTATAELRVTVNAERWAAEYGVTPELVSGTLARAIREGALPDFAVLMPGVEAAGGDVEATPIKWVASFDDQAVPRRQDRAA